MRQSLVQILSFHWDDEDQHRAAQLYFDYINRIKDIQDNHPHIEYSGPIKKDYLSCTDWWTDLYTRSPEGQKWGFLYFWHPGFQLHFGLHLK